MSKPIPYLEHFLHDSRNNNHVGVHHCDFRVSKKFDTHILISMNELEDDQLRIYKDTLLHNNTSVSFETFIAKILCNRFVRDNT